MKAPSRVDYRSRPEADFMIEDAPPDHNLSWDKDGASQQDEEIDRVVENSLLI